jgi:large subunit ribosomal protein L24
MAAKLKIRKGDTVQVIAGKDVGRRGKVLEVMPAERRVLVDQVNMAKRHTRPRPVKGTRGAQISPGGVFDIAAPLRVDNVALICPSCDRPTRVGYRATEAGKVRVCRNCGKDMEKS